MSTRLRRTRTLVRAEDRAARALITVGGIGVVAAVLGIFVYLVLVVLPLFEGGSVRPETLPASSSGPPPRAMLLDEDALAATSLTPQGTFRTVLIADGTLVADVPVWPDSQRPSALSPLSPDGILFGAQLDGSLWYATPSFASSLLDQGVAVPDSPAVVGASMRSGVPAVDAVSASGGFIHATPAGEVRLTVPGLERSEAIRLDNAPTSPQLVAGARSRSGQPFLASLATINSISHGVLASSRTVTPLGQAPRDEWVALPFTLSRTDSPAAPEWLFITADGTSVLALYADGFCLRLAPVAGRIIEVERRRLVDEGRSIASATMLLGGLTLVVGDDAGTVHAWFTARDPDARTPDSTRLVEGHRFRVSESSITALFPASRDRLILAADSAGHATLVHMTSHKRVARVDSRVGPPAAIALSPRADAIVLAGADGRLDPWSVSLGHPKASLHSLFGTPLYEGQTRGAYVYQSSAGSDQAELKMSMVPLIFGTLKATLFATLFAIPLAVLAAIYTSEFLSPRSRRVVKPVIELMASLPSVVLGFVASMVVAPLMAAHLPAVLSCMVFLPLTVLLGAHLWQAAPWASRVRGGAQLGLVGLCAAIGLATSLALTPALHSALFTPTRADTLVRAGSSEDVAREQWPAWIGDRRSLSPAESRLLRAQGLAFRAGRLVRPVEPPADRAPAVAKVIADHELAQPDLRAWLDGTIGGPLPGWLVVLFPPSMLACWMLTHALTRARFNQIARPSALALADLLRFLAILAATIVLDLLLSLALSAIALDPRDSILGPFSVRNSLVVGIIMGFAIIPIIYTISEDAMRGVPNSLRLASLGSGATPWQTALRVVLPVAASGIFSACMIGLGRAVGETMIVLMATGNSPEMNWNMFSGFRTLSANIAVELPEAVENSTHYRTLFLAALTLFAITFAVNTAAELVRQRFRKRAFQL